MWTSLIIFLIFPILWIAGFLVVTDFSVPFIKDTLQFRHILAIFPHADDEAVSCAGFLHRLASSGSIVTLVILTRGEKGNAHATLSPRLKDIRVQEARAAAATLGISRLIQEDFGDGTLHAKKSELTAFLNALIQREQPDLLVTYDLAGFYGHQDHIACAEVVTALRKSRFREIPLWYVTFPKIVLVRVCLPEHIGTGPLMREKQALPTQKIFIGSSVLPKIKAWYTYKSQRASLTKGIGRILPIWFFLSMMLFEYFAEAD